MRKSNERVLVTGGAGFVGSHVADQFLQAGATVRLVDNYFSGSEGLAPEGAAVTEVDIRDEELLDVVESFDPTTIVHLAAIHYVPYCDDNPGETFDVNVMGTRRLLDAARRLDDLERLVYSSSAAVYPPHDGPNEESDEPGPIGVYGQSKLVGEDLVRLFHRDTGVNAVSARLFNVYGPRETNPHLIPAILDQVRDGSRQVSLGNLTPKRDFVHVRDVSDALYRLGTDFDGGYRVYNVGTGTEYSVREVAEHVGDALGEPLEIEQAEERVREADRQRLLADATRLRAEFDWEPEMDFVDGLRELLDEPRRATAD